MKQTMLLIGDRCNQCIARSLNNWDPELEILMSASAVC